MSHTPHELTEEFPNSGDRIHALKATDQHFLRLTEEYHQINRQVHRAETNVEPMEELAEVQLRKKRALLKDQIAAILARA